LLPISGELTQLLGGYKVTQKKGKKWEEESEEEKQEEERLNTSFKYQFPLNRGKTFLPSFMVEFGHS
jgi:hypothetical protein